MSRFNCNITIPVDQSAFLRIINMSGGYSLVSSRIKKAMKRDIIRELPYLETVLSEGGYDWLLMEDIFGLFKIKIFFRGET